MTAFSGRLEARITVPVGGWAVAVTTSGGGGPFTATVAAGSYYVTDLVTAFAAALTAAAGGAWALSQTVTEGTATVKTIIALAAQTYSITWTSTDLRDVLGFNANLASVGSATGALAVIGSWLPDCPKFTPYGDAAFNRYTDLRQSKTPGGVVKSLMGNSYDAIKELRWDMVGNAKAVGLDTVGSWQHFWSAIMTGRYTYITVGDKVKIFWNSTLSSPSNEAYLVAPQDSHIEAVSSGWTGLYKVVIPELVKVA